MKRIHLLLTLFALTAIFGGVVMRQQYIMAKALEGSLITNTQTVAANSLFCAFFPRSSQCTPKSSSSSSVSSVSSKSSVASSSSKSSVASSVSSASSRASSVASSSSSLHGAPFGPGDYNFGIQSGGTTRRYLLHVPASYTGAKLPLVIALHGGGGNAENAMYSFKFNDTADAKKFLVAYPEGTGSQIVYGKVSGSWNAGGCCGEAALKQVDDVGFISTMIDDIASKFAVHTNRVYATGHSNGAMMSYRLACDLSEKIAAIAPVGGTSMVLNCAMKRPVSLLHIHGTQDPCTLYNGSTSSAQCGGCLANYYRDLGIPVVGEGTFQCPSVSSNVDTYRKILLFDTSSSTTFLNSVTCQRYAAPQSWLSNSFLTQNPIDPWGDLNLWKQRLTSTEILFCPVVGMGHTWPAQPASFSIEQCALSCDTKTCSAADQRAYDTYCTPYKNAVGPLSTAISANDEIWKFFSTHTRN